MPTDEMLSPAQTTPLISFVITTYNLPADLLRDCLNSVLLLPLTDDEREIVLVDDGSDEPALNGLQAYADRMTYVRKANGGQSTARNMGIECCHGTYIQFIDGDDMLNSHVYEHCLDIMRRERPDILLFRYSHQPVRHISQTCHGPIEGSEYLRRYNLRVGPGGYLFRRSILADLRFHEGIVIEDEEFTPLLFLRATRVFATDAQAYYYRVREDSTMRKSDAAWVKKRLDDTRTVIFALQEKAGSLPPAAREGLQRRIAQLTMVYLYIIMKQTGDPDILEERVRELHEKELFPLPDRDYNMKYQWFRRMTNTRTGRRLLAKCLRG